MLYKKGNFLKRFARAWFGGFCRVADKKQRLRVPLGGQIQGAMDCIGGEERATGPQAS
jgi:hypothetical protein